jgi:DNA-binding transcriptional LysR family regulator
LGTTASKASLAAIESTSSNEGRQISLNIPTDLLRTLLTVVDVRSFTKAAQLLGVTQPAVSAQIKRLQALLGYELLDKSVPGVSLTPRGAQVVDRARRLLSINDDILQLGSGRLSAQTLRVGIPADYAGSRLPATLVKFRERWPDVSFSVASRTTENLFRDLERGDLDLAMIITLSDPPIAPRHQWTRQTAWVRSDATRLDPDKPVPLVSYSDDCACQAMAVAALKSAGREWIVVFSSRNLASLVAAVGAGFGVMVMPLGRAMATNLTVWHDAPLPKLSRLHCGVFVGGGGNQTAAEELADYLVADLRPEPPEPVQDTAGAAVPLIWPSKPRP